MKCIICETREGNPNIGNGNYCSRLCWNLSLREDYKYLTRDAVKRIALSKHEELDARKDSQD